VDEGVAAVIELKDIDPARPFFSQLEEVDSGPVTVINTFVYPEGAFEAVVEAWRKDSVVMMASAGWVSSQLYRGIGSRVLTNVSGWESAAQLKKAFQSKEFQDILPLYPDGTVCYPQVERKIAVPGICAA
jgi:antibiotic biosynthesis monooxygenase